MSWRLEKQQVAALGEYLAADARRPSASRRRAAARALALRAVEPEWTVGSLGVAYDEDEDRILVAADELVETDDEGNPAPGVEPATARVRITRAQAAAFVATAEALMAAGRPPCRICGRPMDPDGHICPRSNGHGVH